MLKRLHDIRNATNNAIHSSKGKDVLLYIMFVCVAFVFWVFLSLDAEVQRSFDVPVELEDVPDSITLINPIPLNISASVQGKGSQLLRFSWGTLHNMKINFGENVSKDNVMSVSKIKIDDKLRDYFGQGVQILSTKPDSIVSRFTSMPGVKVPLRIISDIHPNLQCIISGPITANVDSISVYSINGVPHSLRHIDTEQIVRSGLKDTTRYEVKLKSVPGMRLIPDRVVVTVPVEPLISQRRRVDIDIMNLPEGTGMITFPSSVEVSYLVPMSAYNDDLPISVYVDFDNVNLLVPKAKVNLSLIPDIYQNVSLQPDSVEYIIEKKQINPNEKK